MQAQAPFRRPTPDPEGVHHQLPRFQAESGQPEHGPRHRANVLRGEILISLRARGLGRGIEDAQRAAVQHADAAGAEAQPRQVTQQQVGDRQRAVRAADDRHFRVCLAGEMPQDPLGAARLQDLVGEQQPRGVAGQQGLPGHGLNFQPRAALHRPGGQHHVAGGQDGVPARVPHPRQPGSVGAALGLQRLGLQQHRAAGRRDGGLHGAAEDGEEGAGERQGGGAARICAQGQGGRMGSQRNETRLGAVLQAIEETVGQRVGPDRIAADRSGAGRCAFFHNHEAGSGKSGELAGAGGADQRGQPGRSAAHDDGIGKARRLHAPPASILKSKLSLSPSIKKSVHNQIRQTSHDCDINIGMSFAENHFAEKLIWFYELRGRFHMCNLSFIWLSPAVPVTHAGLIRAWLAPCRGMA
ncbi:protein of unknown function [Rhodovastum atsumiense]|nr:protein of unknown function [Rhodovastum atsumiense]